jgi:predicted dehydrogenase
VVDLGIHLVDLALWSLGFPKVQNVFSRLYAAGERWSARNSKVEDYASAHLDLDSGAIVQLACSWKLPAGRDAIIQAAFYGTGGGAALRNVYGSFYDFVGERYSGTRCEVLTSGPEPWGGEALIGWTKQLAISSVFDPAIEQLVAVAEALDAIYAQGTDS